MFVVGCKFVGLFLARFDSGLEGIKENEVITNFVKMGVWIGKRNFTDAPYTYLAEGKTSTSAHMLLNNRYQNEQEPLQTTSCGK